MANLGRGWQPVRRDPCVRGVPADDARPPGVLKHRGGAQRDCQSGGVGLAPVLNYADDYKGLQWAPINNTRGDFLNWRF